MYNSGEMPNAPVARLRSSTTTEITAAIDLRGKSLAAALVDREGRVIHSVHKEVESTAPRAVAPVMTSMILAIATAGKRGDSYLSAIGVSVPERLMNPTPITDLISRELTKQGVDIRRAPGTKHARAASEASPHPNIVVSSRRVAAVAGETWCGAASGARNAVVMTLGEKIDAGLLVEGRIVRGRSGLAGAIGWLTLAERYRNEFSAIGCLNVEAGRQSLTRRAVEAWQGNNESLLARLESTDLTPATIVRAARAGDSTALIAVLDICEWIGRAIASLISTLNPEVVVVRGDLGRDLRPFLPEIRKSARRWAHAQAMKDCRIVPSFLGPHGPLIGAARLAQLSKVTS
jgi:glucokinase